MLVSLNGLYTMLVSLNGLSESWQLIRGVRIRDAGSWLTSAGVHCVCLSHDVLT